MSGTNQTFQPYPDVGARGIRTPGPPGERREQVLARRGRLPGGRAVVGGFLIAVSVVAIYAAYTASTARPRQLYVVAARDIPAGARLHPSDLALAALDVPDRAQRRVLFGSAIALTSRGATTTASVARGELVESSAVVGRAGEVGTGEVSIQVDRSRAVAGTLKAGEYVDVLGTFGSGADAYTATMVRHVRVVSVAATANSLGDVGSGQILTLAAPDQMTAEALADANIAAQMTLVRAAEATSGIPNLNVQAPPYRPPSGATGRPTN